MLVGINKRDEICHLFKACYCSNQTIKLHLLCWSNCFFVGCFFL